MDLRKWLRAIALTTFALGVALAFTGFLRGYFSGDIVEFGDIVDFVARDSLLPALFITCLVVALLSLITSFALNAHDRLKPSIIDHLSIPEATRETFRRKHAEAHALMQLRTPSAYRSAILLLDNLLSDALALRGYQGTTHERIRQANSILTHDHRVFRAHRYRNKLAHENDYLPVEVEAQEAFADFTHALKDIGAI